MHFHLPKPLHGWREFAGEVGIIVVGVLIALAAEQVVERWSWSEKVESGRAALEQDYALIVANAREREAEDNCIRARLLWLRNVLDANPGHLPATGDIGAPPARPWYPQSWDSLVASTVAAHMPRDDLLTYGSIAVQARWAEDTAKREIDDWAVIYTMVGPARDLAPAETAQLHRAITDAAFQLNTMRLVAPQLREKIDNTKLLKPADLADINSYVAHILRGPTARGICGRVLSPDPTRVDAPYDPAVQRDALGGDKHQQT